MNTRRHLIDNNPLVRNGRIVLSPGASAILETLTQERNHDGYCGIPVIRLAMRANCAPEHVHEFITELQAAELIELRAQTAQVMMFKVVEPALMMVRRNVG